MITNDLREWKIERSKFLPDSELDAHLTNVLKLMHKHKPRALITNTIEANEKTNSLLTVRSYIVNNLDNALDELDDKEWYLLDVEEMQVPMFFGVVPCLVGQFRVRIAIEGVEI